MKRLSLSSIMKFFIFVVTLFHCGLICVIDIVSILKIYIQEIKGSSFQSKYREPSSFTESDEIQDCVFNITFISQGHKIFGYCGYPKLIKYQNEIHSL